MALRVVLCVDPCSAATRNLVTSMGQKSDVVSTADLKTIYRDTEDKSGDMDNILDRAEIYFSQRRDV